MVMNDETSNYPASPVPARACNLSGQLEMLAKAVDRMTREKEAMERRGNRVTQKELIFSFVPVGIENAIGARRLHGELDDVHSGLPTAKRFNTVLGRLADDGQVRFIQGERCRLYYRNS